MNDSIHLVAATECDATAILGLLEESGLPGDGLEAALEDAFVMLRQGELLGCIALERSGTDGLLRSFAVTPGWRHQGLGDRLYARMLEHARSRGLSRLYLLTTTATAFFARHGFHPIGRDQVPAEIARHVQFRSACPCSATCLLLHLE